MQEQQPRTLRWMRLDNAALIFPAAQRRHWSNAFRISFSFTDPVDPDVLQRALGRIAPRFPSVVVRLRRGLFWHYLEELKAPPAVQADSWQPLVSMTGADVRRCAIRVLYYRDRMAVEFFHAVTDGTGGMVFAKSLAAEYVRERYGVSVPCTDGVKDPDESPREAEFADCFQENAGPLAAPRDDRNVYRAKGEREADRFLHVTTGILDSAQLLRESKARGVTVTAYLTALLLQSLMQMQAADEPRRAHRSPVKVQIPVNLRRLYGGETMRRIADLLGTRADEGAAMTAVVRCNGSCGVRVRTARYDGLKTCFAMHACGMGDTACGYGCLGCGDCVRACAFGALSMSDVSGLPVVDMERCTGCGRCADVCPRGIIALRRRREGNRLVAVRCVNSDRGAVAVKACSSACIGCGKCVKVCAFDAVTVKNNLSWIDDEKCRLCRKCEAACPTGAVFAFNFPQRKTEV